MLGLQAIPFVDHLGVKMGCDDGDCASDERDDVRLEILGGTGNQHECASVSG